MTLLDRRFSLLLAACLLTGCQNAAAVKPAAVDTSIASTPSGTVPRWATYKPQRAGYWYGVAVMPMIAGQESDMVAQARQRAGYDLAAELRSRIQGSQLLEERLEGSALESRFITEIRSQIPELDLVATRVVDQAEANGQIYLLLELDQAQALTILGQELSTLEQQVADLASQETLTLRQSLSRYAQQLKLIAKARQTVEQMQLLSGASQGRMSDSLRRYEQQALSALARVTVGFPARMDPALVQPLTEQLLRQGFAVVPATEARLLVAADLREYDKAQEGRFFHFIDANLSLSERDGAVLGSWGGQAKGVSTVAGREREKALAQLASQLGGLIRQSLLQF